MSTDSSDPGRHNALPYFDIGVLPGRDLCLGPELSYLDLQLHGEFVLDWDLDRDLHLYLKWDPDLELHLDWDLVLHPDLHLELHLYLIVNLHLDFD